MAVRARQAGVDPVGSCVGLRGVRIQNIVNELWGEKIDVVEWSKEPAKYVSNALSPSQVLRVDLDEEASAAIAVVPDRQLSLAIGREGQNARLAAKLTGWSVDIKSNVEADESAEARKAAAAREPVTVDSDLERVGLATRALNVLSTAGVNTVGDVLAKSEAELRGVKGFGAKSYDELMARLDELGLLPVEPETEAEAEAEELEVEAPTADEVAIDEPTAVEEEAEAPAEVAEEPVAVEAEAPVTEEVEEVAAEVEQAPEEAPPPVPELEPEPAVPVPALARSGSLRDVPDDVWTIRRAPSAGEPGEIRFAEDIVGLRGGVTASRGRRGGAQNQARRRPKASKRRRFRR